MPDIFTPEKRSEVMSKIKSKSALEDKFCKLLSEVVYPKGYRYRRNYRKLKGCPDIVFVGKKIAVFLDGTFWHGYRYHPDTTKLHQPFWRNKIETNIKRDKRNRNRLRRDGWKVIRIWEHDFKSKPMICIAKVLRELESRKL